jgi:hypothetical protein
VTRVVRARTLRCQLSSPPSHRIPDPGLGWQRQAVVTGPRAPWAWMRVAGVLLAH